MEINKKYKKVEIEELDSSEVEIKIEFEKEILPKYWKESLKNISKNVDLPGFRKGQVPEKIVIEKVTESAIWEDAVENLIKDVYPEILEENKIQAISRPQITLTKSVPQSELEVKIKTSVFPEIKLADYKKIAEKIAEIKESDKKVEKEEVEKVIEMIRSEKKDKDGKSPELNDEFVKSFGPFENVEDFKKKLEENMVHEKVVKKKGEKRMELMDNIIKESDMKLPNILIEGELERMVLEFKAEIENAGLDFKDYLEKSKTTEEKLRGNWKPQAEKKAKTQLILNEIAEKENIKPEEEKVSKEVDMILATYPDANKERARIYVETLFTNEAIFEFLEKLFKKDS